MSVFHEGERAVQSRAGVEARAQRIGQSIDTTIPLMAEGFLLRQPMAILGTRDSSANVWASLLSGEPGFMRALNERTVEIETKPFFGDPLMESLKTGVDAGMLVLDPFTRKRLRLNCEIISSSENAITLRARQVYFNCPQYIQKRIGMMLDAVADSSGGMSREGHLNAQQRRWISAADTFFIASGHPQSGMDASHRGGNPGFIHVSDVRTLVWPDYEGNNMFQTLGNLEIDPHAGLLFVDFERGSTLQLSGKAFVKWDVEYARKFPGAERMVEFKIEQVIEIENATRLRWKLLEYSPFNPG